MLELLGAVFSPTAQIFHLHLLVLPLASAILHINARVSARQKLQSRTNMFVVCKSSWRLLDSLPDPRCRCRSVQVRVFSSIWSLEMSRGGGSSVKAALT